MSDQEFEQKKDQIVEENVSEDFLSRLHDFMDDQEIQEMKIENPETFKIASRDQANYFLKKLKDLHNEKAKIGSAADFEIKKTTDSVNKWRTKEIGKLQNDEDYITGLLNEFTLAELQDSSKKSISLPYGSLGFKKQQPKFEYDDAVLLAFLKSHINQLVTVKTVESPNKVELKKMADIKDGGLYLDGVQVLGVTVQNQEDKFEVK
jgi:hypothetical protein